MSGRGGSVGRIGIGALWENVGWAGRARGAEAQLVLLLGCEAQLLPSWRALESANPEELAEERRLFYVAATRAKDHLALTRCHVRGGRATGGASQFLAEAQLDTTRRQLAA